MGRLAGFYLSLVWAALLIPAFAAPASYAAAQANPQVTAQPLESAGPDIKRYFNDPAKERRQDRRELIKLLREKVKYVFVIFNENHSFDNEFGTFPGVNGLYSDGLKARPAANTPGFTQTYVDRITGKIVTVRPFRMGPEQNSGVVDTVDHSHTGLAAKLHVVKGLPQMDGFAYDEYYRFAKMGGKANNAMGMQYARLVMSYIDCDTIPFFWKWASHFTIFDNIFATEDTPSAPNAIAMIAGQSGETQWVRHGPGSQGYEKRESRETDQGVPVVTDPQPFWGSRFDTTAHDKQPRGSRREDYKDYNIAPNLTFASLPLTLLGRGVASTMASNLRPSSDLGDIGEDISYIEKRGLDPVNWRWYQEGYDCEETDGEGEASHESYVSHHNGPQYFGYLADTPQLRQSFRGMRDFFVDIAGHDLPERGVFYIRGGYLNQMGMEPPITNPSTPQGEIDEIKKYKAGDDDHPSYSDRQISEAMAARVINAIAGDPALWEKGVIIIAYDESDGFYDHVPPRILSYGPDGLPLSRGIRVPLILISPYARTHAVSHAEGDHNAIIETVNEIFGLPALASLPDEAEALKTGNSPPFNRFGPPGFQQKYLGPRDINSPVTDSLLSGFDPMRLRGEKARLPASFAMIPDKDVFSLPHYNGNGCRSIGIVPEDVRRQIPDTIPPPGFNPLPGTYPEGNYSNSKS